MMLSRGACPRDRKMTSLVMLACVCLLVSPAVEAGMCGSSCLNGGQMIMPNSVFGYCRCLCPAHFSGPKCQFVSKRAAAAAAASPSLNVNGLRGGSKSVTNSHDGERLPMEDFISRLHGNPRDHAGLTSTDSDAD